MVKSEKIFSPQKYLEEITGKCYVIKGDDDVGFISGVLDENGFNLWDYPLSEIDHIVENGIDVVLVECMVFNEDYNQYEYEYCWFEMP